MSVETVLMMSLSEIFGNFHLKNYAASNKHHNLMCGLLGYCGVLYFLIRSFTIGGSLLLVTALWEGMITVLGVLVGYFVLGERFKHPVQWLGLVLALLAVFLVHYGEHIKD